MVKLLNSVLNKLSSFSYDYVKYSYDIFFLILNFLIFFNIKSFFVTDFNSIYPNSYLFALLFLSIFIHNKLILFLNLNFLSKVFCIFMSNALILIFFLEPGNFQVLIKFFFVYSTFLALPRFFADESIIGNDKIFRKIVNNKGPILIIGGAGYIGSHLVRILLEDNKKVRILDNFMYGDKSLEKLKKNKNLQIIKGECTDYSVLIPAMDGCYAVVHLAGLVGDPACAIDPNLTRYTNILSTRLTFIASNSMGIQRFIFASSCSVYGISDKKVNENSKLNPVSLYAKTKIDSENELLKLGKSSSTSVTILRFATVFGDSPRPRFDLVANIFAANVAKNKDINVYGPNQWRPFIHVLDVAKAVQKVAYAKESLVKNEIYNVGDDNLNSTLGNLAKVVYKNSIFKGNSKKNKINLIDGKEIDMRNYMVSFEKIRRKLKFKASISLEEGTFEIIDNFNKKIYKDPSHISYSNYLTTQKYLKKFNKKKINFESIPIFHV